MQYKKHENGFWSKFINNKQSWNEYILNVPLRMHVVTKSLRICAYFFSRNILEILGYIIYIRKLSLEILSH